MTPGIDLGNMTYSVRNNQNSTWIVRNATLIENVYKDSLHPPKTTNGPSALSLPNGNYTLRILAGHRLWIQGVCPAEARQLCDPGYNLRRQRRNRTGYYEPSGQYTDSNLLFTGEDSKRDVDQHIKLHKLRDHDPGDDNHPNNYVNSARVPNIPYDCSYRVNTGRDSIGVAL